MHMERQDGNSMSEKRNVIFSFDYELYLGLKSGSVEKCVIAPTAEMLGILKEHGAKGIFFVDTTWLLRLREAGQTHLAARINFEEVTAQLQTIVSSGHYIFPHLHPHWLDAKYLEKDNQWELADQSRYHFHSLNDKERERLFKDSIALLNEIIIPVCPGYTPSGYRAGGWSIDPFSDFEPHFRKYGIKYEFSKMENSQPYRFNDNFLKNRNGDFTEFPITHIELTSFTILRNRLLAKYLWRTGDRGYGDGTGAVTGKMQSEEIQKHERGAGEMAAIESLTQVKLPAYLKFLARNNYMQFIAHPKMLSRHSIKTFRMWMRTAYDKYEIETDFMKMVPQN